MTARAAMSVGDIMQKRLEVVSDTTTVSAAAAHMRGRRIGSVLVKREGEAARDPDLVGIATETDFVRNVVAKGLPPESTRVATIMAAPILTIGREQSVFDASQLMELNRVRHLCVADGARIVGLVSVRDLVEYFVRAESGPVRDLDDVYRPLSVLMRTAMETIDAGDSLLAAAKRMADKRIGSLLVTESGKITGIVTETDMVRNALSANVDSKATSVGSITSRPVIDIDINRTIRDASAFMAEKGIRHLAVTDQNKIVGILSVRDLIRMISVRDRPRFLAQNKGGRR